MAINYYQNGLTPPIWIPRYYTGGRFDHIYGPYPLDSTCEQLYKDVAAFNKVDVSNIVLKTPTRYRSTIRPMQRIGDSGVLGGTNLDQATLTWEPIFE